ncbi:MAG: hypothetical protein WD069_12165 [Planctomycetales bacterium]
MMRRYFHVPGLDVPLEPAELAAGLSLADRALPEFEDPDAAELFAAAAEFGPLATATGRPVELFVPERYEPGYPYPLIVWLHGRGRSERELAQLMPRVSERNYLGLAFRGTLPGRSVSPRGFGWPASSGDDALFAEELYETVCRLRRAYHVHSERIHLAGFDDGATLALRLFLSRPEWFAGAIAFGGRFRGGPGALARYRDLSGKRVLIGTGARSAAAPVAEAVGTGRLLHSAGLEVTTRTYDAAHELSGEMLAHLNQWVMEGVCATV